MIRAVKYCLILLFVTWHVHAAPLVTSYGLVKSGSFVLSEQPDLKRGDRLVHSLVGYLPVGTRVIVEGKRIVTNLKNIQNETYYLIKSELGVGGLIREDLLIRADNKKLAISIASFEIAIHQPNATKDNPTIRFYLGRNGGNYLELTGESSEGFYDAILHRPNSKNASLPSSEKVRLNKKYVEQKLVSVLDPSDPYLKNELRSVWTNLDQKDNYFDMVVQKVKDKVKDNDIAITQLLGDINDLQCLIGGTLEGKLGFEVFSNGFSLNLKSSLKDQGVKYTFERKKLLVDNSIKYFSGIGVVKCDGLTPIRMQSFTLQEDVFFADKRFSISLKDLEKSKSKWINTLQNSTISNKMVRVSGWAEYNQLIKELNNYALLGGGYLAELTEKQRLLILNYIVSRISFYEHRDYIVDPI